MAKKENEQMSSVPIEVPTIKKIVDCPKCKAKMKVEFEIDLQALIPMTIADTLKECINKGMVNKEEEKEDDKS